MISIIVGVYYKYFSSNENIIEEINSSEIYNQEQLKILEKKILELEIKNNELNSLIKKDKETPKSFSDTKTYNDEKENSIKANNSELDNNQIKNVKLKKSEIKNEIKETKVKDLSRT